MSSNADVVQGSIDYDDKFVQSKKGKGIIRSIKNYTVGSSKQSTSPISPSEDPSANDSIIKDKQSKKATKREKNEQNGRFVDQSNIYRNVPNIGSNQEQRMTLTQMSDFLTSPNSSFIQSIGNMASSFEKFELEMQSLETQVSQSGSSSQDLED